ncbi:MAG: YraN family protein [Gammaproteobacteria bacterium]|nr:YraN family protein [Gammaproteobacteria bacterium]
MSSGTNTRAVTGRKAERVARRLLERHGLKTIRTNYSCPLGEIDLIMRDANELVFVEVRARADNAWVSAGESIGRQKQRRLLAAAEHYLYRARWPSLPPCRFDVVLVTTGNEGYRVEWLRDAFR